ncbi:MAG: DNA-3-methyladenine glycosylase [Rhodospirillales bacterium]|nr:DNA-3-methyladenine glycosylase [Rhodospirillales bacterium]
MTTSLTVLKLPFIPPYDWGALCEFLAARAIPGVESVSGGVYRRTVRLNTMQGVIEVRLVPHQDHLELRVPPSDPEDIVEAAMRVRRMFDCDAKPQIIARHLSRDPSLKLLVKRYPGLRVPGAWDGFELTVRAIIGQQISVKSATAISGRIAGDFGVRLRSSVNEDTYLLFPSPEAISVEDPSQFGMPKARCQALHNLANAVASGGVIFDPFANTGQFKKQLLCLVGVGEWTAEYVLMRFNKDPDAFPHSDLGLLRGAGISYQSVDAKMLYSLAENWRPWRAYAAMYLWKSYANNLANGALRAP